MDSLISKISTTLKQLRSEKGWSLDKTSLNTGVSKAMLGQIERGESSPTITTLWKIACGFDVSFSSFVENLNPHQPEISHRKLKLKQLHQQDNKIKVMPIFPYDKSLRFEVFIIELLAGCEHLSPAHQKGVVEHVIVSEGTIEVLVNDTWHLVKKNEGLRFNADKAHGYRNKSQKTAVFNNIIHY